MHLFGLEEYVCEKKGAEVRLTSTYPQYMSPAYVLQADVMIDMGEKVN